MVDRPPKWLARCNDAHAVPGFGVVYISDSGLCAQDVAPVG